MASKLPMFGFRTQRDILDKLSYIAEYNGRSANKELEMLLKKYITQFEDEHGEIHLPISEELYSAKR